MQTLMQRTMMTLEAALREEDLLPGQPWVHPQSCLEYEDFHAFFCGKDPIPHWRNARIKEIHTARQGWSRAGQEEREPYEAFFARRVAYFCDNFDRQGTSQFGVASRYAGPAGFAPIADACICADTRADAACR